MDPSPQFVPLENYPELAKNVPCILGIDEAGRGPVLGPLVYSIFICPLEHQGILKELGVAGKRIAIESDIQFFSFYTLDSKVLDVAQREKFAKTVSESYSDRLGWSVKIVTPQTISHSMQMVNKYNLNSLSYDTVYSILERIKAQGVQVDHVFVDTLGKPETYKKQLSERFPGYSFTVCSKADSIYPVVGAASIFAKVTRDFNLENWKPQGTSLSFDRDFGSGYPSGTLMVILSFNDFLFSRS